MKITSLLNENSVITVTYDNSDQLAIAKVFVIDLKKNPDGDSVTIIRGNRLNHVTIYFANITPAIPGITNQQTLYDYLRDSLAISLNPKNAVAPVKGVLNGQKTKVNDDVLANEPDLTLPVKASTKYDFEIWLMHQAVSNETMKIKINVPAGTGAFYNVNGSVSLKTEATEYLVPNDASVRVLQIKGVIDVGITAGNVAFAWAQMASSGNSISINNLSFIYLREL